ncbi:uncharacterized protein LOC107369455 [Tetranychus urticae]|uniref:uncharacterized protein LOC107369455 n=1 Tax=Tetranychus urticae TaxID=32264 RepID=UPI00077BE6D9|nr:uncharacterized protein LOC107369455 [Tetranychus urticae]
MNRSNQILSPVNEPGYRYPTRHRNSSPSVKPRQYFPRRSCDGHFAFLTASTSATSTYPIVDNKPGLTNTCNGSNSNLDFITSMDNRTDSPTSSSNSTSSISPISQSIMLNVHSYHTPQPPMHQQNQYQYSSKDNRHYQLKNQQPNQHRSSIGTPQVQRTQHYFRPRVNTLPDALNGIVLNVQEPDRRTRSRSQSYTPPTGNHYNNMTNGTVNGGGRRSRRKSQERLSYSDADSWTNYRKTSIDPRKFSISEVNDDCLPERDAKTYRVLVLGADKVGKTTLLHQLIRQEEMEKLSRRERSIKMLIPIDNVDISIIFDNQPFNDDLLDDRIHHEKIFYDSVIVIYSITDRRSFEIAAQLLTMAIFDYKRLNPDLKVCLIGNKSDLVRARTVDPSEGKSLANRFEVDFHEASIELEDNLDHILSWISNNVRTRFGFMPINDSNHGKFRRALSFVKRVLRKPDLKHRSCDSINAI